MTKKHLPAETNTDIDEIPSIIKDVIIMDEFPDDKIVEISVEFMVVPKTMNIKISNKI